MLPKGANFSTYSHSSCHRLKPLRVQRRNRPHWVSNYWNQMGFCLQVKVRRPKGWFTYEICCGITDPLKSLASPGYQRNHAGLGIFFINGCFFMSCAISKIYFTSLQSPMVCDSGRRFVPPDGYWKPQAHLPCRGSEPGTGSHESLPPGFPEPWKGPQDHWGQACPFLSAPIFSF